MYIPFASFMGVLITLLIMFNSVLSVQAGQILSLLVFHLVGFSTISLILLFTSKSRHSGQIPLYLCSAGVIGVLVVFLNNICFAILGASVTLSLVIMGQTTGSILIDSFGFLNMNRHRFEKRKLFGYLLMLSGILVMVDTWKFHSLYVLLAFVTGILVILTMVLNSQLGIRIGVLKATRMNYLTGLATVIFLILFTGFELKNSLGILAGIHPVYIFGGGITGVCIVIGFNMIVPKIPTVYTTILVFLGQIGTGLIIDGVSGQTLIFKTIAGAGIVLLGLGFNIRVDLHGQKQIRHSAQKPVTGPVKRSL